MTNIHNRTVRTLLSALGAALCLSTLAAPASGEGLPAFPGAEGAGMYAIGGRGGDVYHVTNLNDDGPGSLRFGVTSAEGPRTIVFDVGGTIELESRLIIDKPFLTIAGQTAPGGGVTLKGYHIDSKSNHDVVIRYIRVRTGDINTAPNEYEPDAIWVRDSQDVIVDHVSGSWGTDEVISVTHDATNVTVQWCIISEALYESNHHKGAHGYGSLIRTPGNVTFHHNLFAHNSSRNPRPGTDVKLDFVNNVLYNGGNRFGYGAADPMSLNYVGNYVIAGPNTQSPSVFHGGSAETNVIYQEGNFFDTDHNGAPSGQDMGWTSFSGEFQRADQRFDLPPVATQPAPVAYELVLEHAGDSIHRDAVDQRVVEGVRQQTGAIINSQDEVGGWPELDTGDTPLDTDQDGMPDDWEQANGLDPDNPDDRNEDRDGDGYTELEHYLNSLVPPVIVGTS